MNHLTPSDACDVGLCNPQRCLVITASEYLMFFKISTLRFRFLETRYPGSSSFMNHVVWNSRRRIIPCRPGPGICTTTPPRQPQVYIHPPIDISIYSQLISSNSTPLPSSLLSPSLRDPPNYLNTHRPTTTQQFYQPENHNNDKKL